MTPGGPDLQSLVRPGCLCRLWSGDCSGRRGCLLSTHWPVHPGPGFVFLGNASIAKPSAGAGVGPLPQTFASALFSSPFLQPGMVLELIFTATPMLPVWSLRKAFRRARIPQISQLLSCWEQRFAPDLFFIYAHHLPGACRDTEVFLAFLMLTQIPACLEQQQMHTASHCPSLVPARV